MTITDDDDDASAHPPRGGHPLQPIVVDERGVARFKPNKIVCALLQWSSERGMGMNELWIKFLPDEDWEQFAQLIGYSVGGAADLSYFSDEAYFEAEKQAKALIAGHQDPSPRT